MVEVEAWKSIYKKAFKTLVYCLRGFSAHFSCLLLDADIDLLRQSLQIFERGLRTGKMTVFLALIAL